EPRIVVPIDSARELCHLNFGDDDGIVVVVMSETRLEWYLGTPETNRKRELHHGQVCEPPAPYFSHQQLVLRVARLLCDHVEPRKLGQVAIAPGDVILDAEAALGVQPDVLFIAEARTSIIRNQVWGAPDLVVEVLSGSNHGYDRGQKLKWYAEHGARECGLVEPLDEQLLIIDFSTTPPDERLAKGPFKV